MKFSNILLVIVLIIFFGWILNNLLSNNRSLPIIYQFDPTKYQGLWYEIARLPVYYQNGCTNSTANYTLNNDNTIGVTNQCQVNNNIIQVKGVAKPKANQPGRFDVYFENNPEAGEYNIIYLDPNYQYALVGTSDRNSLWILSRNANINDHTFQDLVWRAKQLGYDTDKLIIN